MQKASRKMRKAEKMAASGSFWNSSSMHCKRYFSSSERPLNTGLDTPLREIGERGKRRGDKKGLNDLVKNTRTEQSVSPQHSYETLTLGSTYSSVDMTNMSGVRTPSFNSNNLSNMIRVLSCPARCFSPTDFNQGRP